ncbi:hypothetical protein I79_023501 [Cricetulus griseus]|uniref:Uncharacterized protein n=1 Tax=Cricetulus griseus TaxID=10029 RepID=G3II40_CRIGR|nr:hypothetical protein I79_023501 [Cricetulus griseus]
MSRQPEREHQVSCSIVFYLIPLRRSLTEAGVGCLPGRHSNPQVSAPHMTGL